MFFDGDAGEKKPDYRDRPLPSEILGQPYVVGLHKSRPDGAAWQTEGPVLSGDRGLQDYQHPDYARTGRYQSA